MERNPQRELLVSCGMWCVACWRLSRPYCLSSSQQQGSWVLAPRVPCGLEVYTPSTWRDILQRELLVSWVVNVVCRLATCASLLPVIFATTKVSWALTPRVPCGLEVCTPSTWKEIRSVSCWFHAECSIVAWRLSPRYCLSSSQQQSSWALIPRVPCGLEVCTPGTWKEIRSVIYWFHAECGVSGCDFRLAISCHLRNSKAVGHLLLASCVVMRFARPAHGKKSAASVVGFVRIVVCRLLATFASLLPVIFATTRQLGTYSSRPVWS